MTTMKKTAREAMTRGRDTAVRVGKTARSATVAGARAAAAAAIAAGTLEAKKVWKQTDPIAAKKRTRVKVGAALAGAAVLGAAGVAIAKSRSRENGKTRRREK